MKGGSINNCSQLTWLYMFKATSNIKTPHSSIPPLLKHKPNLHNILCTAGWGCLYTFSVLHASTCSLLHTMQP
jgi:hypothetical protein